MNHLTHKFLALCIAILSSMLINTYLIDELLDIFVIMSYFSLVCNRIAIALFIYFLIDYTVDLLKGSKRRYNLKRIANYLFIIYVIGLVGLLYGRHLPEDISYAYVSGMINNYLFVSTLVFLSVLSIIYFVLRNPKKDGINTVLTPIMIIGIVNLISLIISKQTPPNSVNSFNFDTIIPLWLNYLHLRIVILNLLGNILVTVPLGLYIGFKKSFIEGIVISVLVIHLVEFIQAITNLGFYDIDDILLNGIGAIVGVTLIQIPLKLNIIHNT